ncbi:MAG: response regulator transcription factor [Chloroflexi bacterium]|nr:response regulator transcription factor [Chloroflexota bacterium]
MQNESLPTILLVEDAADLALVIQRELTHAGYEVLCATDGLSALELHASHRPDALILDWMLPKLDGIEVLRQIRQTSATPVLMLTARSEELDRVMGLEVGADDYLSKPFSMLELIARVNALLRRTEMIRQLLAADLDPSQEPQLAHKGLVVDIERHLVLLHNNPLDLSRTEFDLLHLLLRNPGRAFSRTYLLETIWGAAYVGGDRSVDNAILRLRKKLDDLGDEIETVWGVGYRLRP